MSQTNTDQMTMLDTGNPRWVYTLAFHPDEEQLLSGSTDGIRQWQLANGQEVTKQTGMRLTDIVVSRDHKWIGFGTWDNGASVWDDGMHNKVIDVEGTHHVGTVDVSPDSTWFATGTGRNERPDSTASIWSIETGKRLVGPLKHGNYVVGIRFSPNGEQFATACSGGSIRVFNSHDGDQLVEIKTIIPKWTPAIPIAWSADGQQIFAVCNDQKIRCFDVSTGSQLAESPILDGDDIFSLALAANGKFIATFTRPHAISFLDALALTRIGSAIDDGELIRSIAISPDSSCLATGRKDGKIVLRDLSKILPDSYGPFHVATRGKQSVTSTGHDNDSNPAEPAKTGGHSEDGDGDLLEVEVGPSTAPAPDFDFEDPPSPTSSADRREDRESRDTSHALIAESSQGRSMFKTLLQRSKKVADSHRVGRRFGKSPQPPDRQSPSHSPTKVDVTNKGPSWMAAAERNARTSTGFPKRRKRKPPTNLAVTNRLNEASSSGQGATDRRAADPAQQANDSSQPSSRGVHITHQSDEGNATLAITFPAWLLCIRSDAHDRAD